MAVSHTICILRHKCLKNLWITDCYSDDNLSTLRQKDLSLFTKIRTNSISPLGLRQVCAQVCTRPLNRHWLPRKISFTRHTHGPGILTIPLPKEIPLYRKYFYLLLLFINFITDNSVNGIKFIKCLHTLMDNELIM